MKYGLKNFTYVFSGLLIGGLIGCLLVGIKCNINRENGSTKPLREDFLTRQQANVQVIEAAEDSADVNLSETDEMDETSEVYDTLEAVDTDTTSEDNFDSDEASGTDFDRAYDDNDLVHYLGHDFSDIQSRFTRSEQILSSEYQYFKEECLAVSYDNSTREVLCIENDGEGINPVTICGISAGMTKEQVYDLLMLNFKIAVPESDDGVLKFSSSAGDVDFSVEINFDKDTVRKVTCRKAMIKNEDKG